MTKRARMARYAGLAGLILIANSASIQAGVLYSVRDVGISYQSQLGLNNLTGRAYLQVDAAGQVSPQNEPNPLTYTGPIPSGMRALNNYYPHASADGQYQVGTAFANPSPAAFWAGFVVHNGTATAMGTLGGGSSYSQALGVNNSGTIVGSSSATANGFGHAIVVDSSGKMTDLGTLGSWYTAALALNNKGMIVGESGDQSNFGFRAFISDGNSLTDLNTLISAIPGFSLISATAINEAGQIAVYGHFATDPESFNHKILLSPLALGIPSLLPVAQPLSDAPPVNNPQPAPIPEPSPFIAFGLIATVVAVRRMPKFRRQR